MTPVADAPTTSDLSVAVVRNTVLEFAAADFPFTDADPGDTLQSVRVTAPVTVGTLTLNGVDVIAGQVISRADIDAGLLRFTPQVNDLGVAYDSFDFRVSDGALDSTATVTLTIDVTPANAPPVAVDSQISAAEDTAYTFSTGDFGFTDADVADQLERLTVGSLPSGSLALNGVAVAPGQVVTRADLDAGLLTFTSSANANGIGLTSFAFTVNDGTTDAAEIACGSNPLNAASRCEWS